MICFKPLKEGDADTTKCPTSAGLLSIFKACETRKDDVYQKYFHLQEDILSFKINVSNHHQCRSKYCSSTNIKHCKAGTTSSISHCPDNDDNENENRRAGGDYSQRMYDL